MPQTHKPFPLPLVAFGPGSQAEDEAMDFLPMPRDMHTYRAPPLPEPEALASHGAALEALHQVLALLRGQLNGTGDSATAIDISALGDADRALVNQVLGEGEVAVQVTGERGLQAQESVFAGIWRVLLRDGGAIVRDTIEVGAFPRGAAAAARDDGLPMPPLPAIHPPGTMNAPAVLEELREHSMAWAADPDGSAPHVINLTLLPLAAADSEYFESRLGRGRVLVLSRGYGNCRIADTRVAGVWRVTYFNSSDIVILDTLEVGNVPEVALAARQDLEDSAERLQEVLEWVQTS